MTQDVCFDTVCTLMNAGIPLQTITTGADAYDYTCNEFYNMFANSNYPLDAWNKALDRYIQSGKNIIRASIFKEILSDTITTETNYYNSVRQRTNKKLWEYTGRMMQHGLSLTKFLPTKEEAKSIGIKHKIPERLLELPTEKGGQLKLIQAFVGEYRAYKEAKIPFKWILQVVNNEVIWGDNDDGTGNK